LDDRNSGGARIPAQAEGRRLEGRVLLLKSSHDAKVQRHRASEQHRVLQWMTAEVLGVGVRGTREMHNTCKYKVRSALS
jgi:hypothetical protein